MPEEPIEQTADSSVDSDAAFAEGFSEVRPESAKPEPKVETPAPAEVETPEAKQEEPQPEQSEEAAAETPPETPDPLAGLKAELESIKGKLASADKIPDRLRNIEGHIGGLTSQLKSIAASTAKAAVEKAGGEAPTTQQIASASASSEKWTRLKEDFPDWAEAQEEREAQLEARIKAAIPQPAQVDVNGIKTDVATHVAPLVRNEIAAAREFMRVDAKHEGWEETVQTPEFKSWFAKQAPEMRALSASSKAKDAIQLLDAFKASAKPADKQQQRQRLERATAPRGVPAATPAPIDDETAFEQGFKQGRSG